MTYPLEPKSQRKAHQFEEYQDSEIGINGLPIIMNASDFDIRHEIHEIALNTLYKIRRDDIERQLVLSRQEIAELSPDLRVRKLESIRKSYVNIYFLL